MNDEIQIAEGALDVQAADEPINPRQALIKANVSAVADTLAAWAGETGHPLPAGVVLLVGWGDNSVDAEVLGLGIEQTVSLATTFQNSVQERYLELQLAALRAARGAAA